MAKEVCKCGKMALYYYMPGYADKKREDGFFCNDCISSPEDKGCSCNYKYCKYEKPEGVEDINWRWIEKDNIWINLDKRGRPYSCVEFDYDEEGYDVPTWWSDLKWFFSWKWFIFTVSFKRWWRKHICVEVPADLDI